MSEVSSEHARRALLASAERCAKVGPKQRAAHVVVRPMLLSYTPTIRSALIGALISASGVGANYLDAALRTLSAFTVSARASIPLSAVNA